MLGPDLGTATAVSVGGQKAAFQVVTPGTLSVTLPSPLPAGSYPVVVTNPDGSSPPLTLVVADPPGAVAGAPAAPSSCPRPPAGATGLSVNGTARWTSSRAVRLSVRWPRCATKMLLSNTPGFASSVTLAVAASGTWILPRPPGGHGTATVYLRFSGGGTGSATTYRDSIAVDLVAPRLFSAGATRVTGPAVRAWTYAVRAKATDVGSGVARVMLGRRASSVGAVMATYRSVTRVRLGGTDRPRLLYLRVQDTAGLWSRWLRVVPR